MHVWSVHSMLVQLFLEMPTVFITPVHCYHLRYVYLTLNISLALNRHFGVKGSHLPR